jgi:ectoine hydroxylase-related dioxygenase (phytanoyl-CoA dioxygenase family)
MSRQLTSEEIGCYTDDGALVLRDVIAQSWLTQLAEAVERDIANPGPFYHGYQTESDGHFHGNLRIWQNDETFRRFCLESELPKLARQFLQSSKVNLLYDQLFVKESGTTNRTRWHNDEPYWPIRGWQVMSFWVALDETTADSGALEFVRGSHQWNRWFQPETFGVTKAFGAYERNPDYEDIPDIEADRDAYDIVSWDLSPGDVYVFHALTVHGAPGNSRRDRRRRGYTVRYTGDDVTYDDRPGISKQLLTDALQNGEALDCAQYPVIIQTPYLSGDRL